MCIDGHFIKVKKRKEKRGSKRTLVTERKNQRKKIKKKKKKRKKEANTLVTEKEKIDDREGLVKYDRLSLRSSSTIKHHRSIKFGSIVMRM